MKSFLNFLIPMMALSLLLCPVSATAEDDPADIIEELNDEEFDQAVKEASAEDSEGESAAETESTSEAGASGTARTRGRSRARGARSQGRSKAAARRARRNARRKRRGCRGPAVPSGPKGIVVLKSNRPAEVLIDGQSYGRCNLRRGRSFILPKGRHRVTLKAGSSSRSKGFSLANRQRRRLRIPLK